MCFVLLNCTLKKSEDGTLYVYFTASKNKKKFKKEEKQI